MLSIEGRVLTPEGFRKGRLAIDGERIERFDAMQGAGSNVIIPGFIDLHCHGGGGADVMEAADSTAQVARAHARGGTTAFLATTMTAPAEEIERALQAIGQTISNYDQAAVLGVHLEGPFISRDKLGAQPDFALKADLELMARWLALVAIKVVTLAPEADPEGTFTRWLTNRGVRVQIGHSACDYETACTCFQNGRSGVTHLFNAMSPLLHRAPGIVGAALAHAEYAELIPDLLHVHPGAIRVALRAIPGLYAVTDATAASGMPNGAYRLGRQSVRKCDNGVRLENGTLAGSSLTMIEAFRNLVSIGLDLEEASRRTSTIAAEYLGLSDRGRLAPGYFADAIVLDAKLEIVSVFLKGQKLLNGMT